jgi:hypothetical protein
MVMEFHKSFHTLEKIPFFGHMMTLDRSKDPSYTWC